MWIYKIIEESNTVKIQIYSSKLSTEKNDYLWRIYKLEDFINEFKNPIKYAKPYQDCIDIARDELIDRGLINE